MGSFNSVNTVLVVLAFGSIISFANARTNPTCAEISITTGTNQFYPSYRIESKVPPSRGKWEKYPENSFVSSINVRKGCSLRVCHYNANRVNKAQDCHDFDRPTNLSNETEVLELYRWDRLKENVLGLDCSCEAKCEKSCETHSITDDHQCATLFQDSNCTDCRFDGIPLIIGKPYERNDDFSVFSSIYINPNNGCSVQAVAKNVLGKDITLTFNANDEYLHHINKERFDFKRFKCDCDAVYFPQVDNPKPQELSPGQIFILSLVAIVVFSTVLLTSLLIYKCKLEEDKHRLYNVVDRLHEDYNIPYENLEIDNEQSLGEGQFATVYKAILTTHLANNESIKEEVAVKIPKMSSMESNSFLRCLAREICILSKLQGDKTFHPNIVRMKGVAVNEGDVILVLELCKYRSLEKLLRDYKLQFLESLSRCTINARTPSCQESLSDLGYSTCSIEIEEPSVELRPQATDSSTLRNFINSTEMTECDELAQNSCFTCKKLIFWASQILSAMEYIDERKILHLDLQARNAFIDEDFDIKLGDFGLSKELVDSDRYIKPPIKDCLPLYAMAPEAMGTYEFTHKTEVFAFGVFLWEMFSLGETPYADFVWRNAAELKAKLEAGYRLPKPDLCPEKIYEQMISCWDKEPSNRPDFRTLRAFFKTLVIAD